MRRTLLSAAAAAVFIAGAPEIGARTARPDPEKDCRDYCGEMAANRCDDVSSTWCNVYIIGCLAGCGVSHL